MGNDGNVVKSDPRDKFYSAYREFMHLFEEAQDRVDALSSSRGGNGLLVAGDIKSERMRYFADRLEKLHEQALDAAEGLIGVDVRTREAINRLHLVAGAMNQLERDCLMYAAYLRDRGDPEFLDEEELSRLGYLPSTQSYFVQGTETTWRDVLRGLVRMVDSFR